MLKELQRESASRPLKQIDMWGYTASTMAMTMCSSITTTYYFFFLTNIVMMSPVLMGYITTTKSVLGLIWAPIAGGLVQTKMWKGGKFTTWMRWFVPFSSILTIMQFINVQAKPMVQFAYYVGLAVFALIIGSFSGTAQLALIPFMAKESQQRVQFTSIRSTIATAGQVLYAAITIPLVNMIGKGDMGKGYLVIFACYSALQVILIEVAAHIGKPYDLYPVEVADAPTEEVVAPKKEKYTLGTYVSCLFGNKACFILFFGDFCKSFASMLYRASASYYCTYYLGDYNVMTRFQLTVNLTMLVGSYLAPWFTAKLGKKWSNTLAYGGFAVSLVLAGLIGVGKAWGIMVFIGLGRFFSGINASLSPAMYSDIGDEWELKTGKAMHPFYMMIFNLAFSVSSLFLNIVLSGCLAAVGFDAKYEVTQPMLNMMSAMVSFIPGIPLALATLLSCFYPLDEKKMAQVRVDLAKARAERAALEESK